MWPTHHAGGCNQEPPPIRKEARLTKRKQRRHAVRIGNAPPGTWGQRGQRSPGDDRPLTCRSQLLWPSLRSSGEVRFPRRLRNCFHRHTYFSVK